MLTVDTKIKDLALSAANKLNIVTKAAQSAFINRSDAIWAITCAIASGEHVILLGPPGTAKTSLTSYYAKALGLSYFSYALNPDTLRDDLFGPIDPKSFEKGKWERVWSGLATNKIVFLDETGKASGQVINMLVDAMEERVARMGVNLVQIPLHTLIGATNESVYDLSPAIWDRFTLRSAVNYVSSECDFLSMLTSKIDNPPECYLTEMETANMLYLVKQMACNPPEKVTAKLANIWSDFRLKFSSEFAISDRRWRRVLRVAAGFSLLSGSTTITEGSLLVLKYMLWNEEDQIEKVCDVLTQHLDLSINPTTSAISLETVLSEIEHTLNTGKPLPLKDKAQIKVTLKRLERSTTDPDMLTRIKVTLAKLGG